MPKLSAVHFIDHSSEKYSPANTPATAAITAAAARQSTMCRSEYFFSGSDFLFSLLITIVGELDTPAGADTEGTGAEGAKAAGVTGAAVAAGIVAAAGASGAETGLEAGMEAVTGTLVAGITTAFCSAPQFGQNLTFSISVPQFSQNIFKFLSVSVYYIFDRGFTTPAAGQTANL